MFVTLLSPHPGAPARPSTPQSVASQRTCPNSLFFSCFHLILTFESIKELGSTSPSFGHNLCFKYSNGTCKLILNICIPRSFQWYKELFNPMSFDFLKLLFENLKTHWDSNSQSGSPFGSVWVHSLTLSYTPGNMKCDSRVSLSTHTFPNPCFDHEPKVRVATFIYKLICEFRNQRLSILF
jgi:hypothetical protein